MQKILLDGESNLDIREATTGSLLNKKYPYLYDNYSDHLHLWLPKKISFLDFEKALENQREVEHFTTITWTYIPMEIKDEK